MSRQFWFNAAASWRIIAALAVAWTRRIAATAMMTIAASFTTTFVNVDNE